MKGESSRSINWCAMSDSEEKKFWSTDIQNNNKSPFYFANDDDEENFSFYTTNTTKLVHNFDSGTSNNPLYTSAFPSWSPIASGFQMTPGNCRKNNGEANRVAEPEKPSYSDIVSKSPVNLFSNPKNRISSTPINESQRRVSRHSADNFESCPSKEKMEKNVKNHKWFSMEDLDQRESTNSTNSKNSNKNEDDKSKTKIRGHSSPGLLNDDKCKEKVKIELKYQKNCKKVSENVENKTKLMENETKNWQSTNITSDTKNKKNYHRRSVDKGLKEVSKKSTIRKKSSSDARFYFDYIFLTIASNLSICADWIGRGTRWFVDLVVDVSIMSGNLSWHLFQLFCTHFTSILVILYNFVWKKWKKWIPYFSFKSRFVNQENKKKTEDNIPLPATRDEAMRRLLSCKGKDPYSILGVSHTATDEEIKKYYKKQAFLVHPDKNRTVGAEEAFKVLAHAFDIIGDPHKRKDYDSKRQEAQQLEETWNEFADLLSQLQEKMDQVANTIKCTNCKRRHRRIKVERPRYSARFCKPCKIMHAAREGDIWAETRVLGFLWHYYACMDGAVYDVTEWAACQSNNLKHLRANTHTVQYRIISSSKQNSSSFQSSHSESNFEDMFKNMQNKTSKSDFSKKKKNKKK